MDDRCSQGLTAQGLKLDRILRTHRNFSKAKVPEVFKMTDPISPLLPTTLVVASPKFGF